MSRIPSNGANGSERTGENQQRPTSVELRTLNLSQVQAIDRALQEVGEYGEVRLIVNRGRLRFIGKFTTECVSIDE